MPETSLPILFAFDNTYARLPDTFYARQLPTRVKAPTLIKLNEALARQLGLDPAALSAADAAQIFSGNRRAAGAEPLAQAYAGHQFGNFQPQLGDGRAILLGEVVDQTGQRRDIQLKGSGPTPFSRNGDGRAALGPVLREYIVSEAFAALGIPATRALAAVATGESVWRETPQPGAVLTRVSASHVRVGTFQYFAARGDTEAVRTLADYVIDRHYPKAANAENRYRALLDQVIAAQARLVAQWLLVGFIHGVMNTDNCSIAGETIDFGPCAFMDAFNPGQVFSSIDRAGRYAYAMQPRLVKWNLARFAETLLPLLAATTDAKPEAGVEVAQAALAGFSDVFEAAYAAGLRRKLGLMQSEPDDLQLGQDLLQRMAEQGADFTIVFRGLSAAAGGSNTVRDQFADPAAFDEWAVTWRARLASEGGDPVARQVLMRSVNPAFIPRNHRIEEVIVAAVSRSDFAPFERLMAVLATPYDDQPDNAAYADAPKPDEVVQATFCGT
jgi:serine/tyrosine/threonine adenylyltransferase